MNDILRVFILDGKLFFAYLWAVLGTTCRVRVRAVGGHLWGVRLLRLHAFVSTVVLFQRIFLCVTQTRERPLQRSPVCSVGRHVQSVFIPSSTCSWDWSRVQATPTLCPASVWFDEWCWGIAVAGNVSVPVPWAGGDAGALFSQIPHVRNRGAGTDIRAIFELVHPVVRAVPPSP